MLKVLKSIDTAIDRASHYTLVVSIFVMLFLSVIAIVLRWFGQSLSFIEPFVRHLVLLATFLGGVLASGRGTHIGIDVLGKFLETLNMHSLCMQLKRLISLASFATLIWLVVASVHFVKMEMEFGKEAFFGLSSGVVVTIIPFGFGLIAYRFLFVFLASFTAEAQKAHETAPTMGLAMEIGENKDNQQGVQK